MIIGQIWKNRDGSEQWEVWLKNNWTSIINITIKPFCITVLDEKPLQ